MADGAATGFVQRGGRRRPCLGRRDGPQRGRLPRLAPCRGQRERLLASMAVRDGDLAASHASAYEAQCNRPVHSTVRARFFRAFLALPAGRPELVAWPLRVCSTARVSEKSRQSTPSLSRPQRGASNSRAASGLPCTDQCSARVLAARSANRPASCWRAISSASIKEASMVSKAAPSFSSTRACRR